MTQFVRGELISIDELEQAADLEPAWHKLLKMCEELSEYCLGFPQDSDLIAGVVQSCLQLRLRSRKRVGIGFLRASLPKLPKFSGTCRSSQSMWATRTLNNQPWKCWLFDSHKRSFHFLLGIEIERNNSQRISSKPNRTYRRKSLKMSWVGVTCYVQRPMEFVQTLW